MPAGVADPKKVELLKYSTKPMAKTETNEEEEAGKTASTQPSLGTIGFAAIAVSLTNSVVGSGLFCIPNTLYQTGWALGSVLIICFCLVMWASAMLLAKSCEAAKLYNFHDLSLKAYGKWFALLLDVFVFMDCFLTVIIYLQTLGNSIDKVFLMFNENISDKRSLWACLAGGVSIVMSFFGGSLDDVVWLQYLGVGATIYNILLVFIAPISGFKQTNWVNLNNPWKFKKILNGVNALGFSFTNYFCACRLYKEAKTKSEYSPAFLSSYAFMGLSHIAYGIIALALVQDPDTFFDGVDHDFGRFDKDIVMNGLHNWTPWHCSIPGECKQKLHWSVGLGFLALAISLLTTLPIYIFEITDSLTGIISQIKKDFSPSNVYEYGTSIGVGVTASAIAVFVPTLSLVIDFDAIFVLAPLMFLFPPIIYLKITSKDGSEPFYKIIAISLLVFFPFFVGASFWCTYLEGTYESTNK